MPRLRLSRGRLLAALILSLAQPALASLAPSDFEYRAALEPASLEGVVRLWLPRDVLRMAARDHSDIRLLDDQNREVPYVIYAERGATLQRDYFDLKVLSYRELTRGAQLVVERPEKRTALNGLAFATPNRDFQKQVIIETSPDRVHWKEWRRDTLFDFSSRVDLRQTEITVPATPDRYLRITLQDLAEAQTATAGQLHVRYQGLEVALQEKPGTRPFRIDGVRAWLGENITRESMLDRVIELVPSKVTLNEKGNSIFVADLGNVPLTLVEIDVSTPRYFYRRVQVWTVVPEDPKREYCVGEGWLYHLPGMTQAQTKIAITGATTPKLRIEILNGDNLPVLIKRVSWQWPLSNLFFIAEPERRYTLYFGNSTLMRPDYETARLLPESTVNANPGQQLYPPAQLRPVEKNPLQRVASPQWNESTQRAVLVSVVMGLGLCLGYWAYTLLRKTSV